MTLSNNEAQFLLGSADDDQSDGIDMREFISIITTPINEQDLEEKLGATFRVFDKDENEVIKANKLERFVRGKRHRSIWSINRMIYLWDNELTEDEADDMINQADPNKIGTISCDAFV